MPPTAAHRLHAAQQQLAQLALHLQQLEADIAVCLEWVRVHGTTELDQGEVLWDANARR